MLAFRAEFHSFSAQSRKSPPGGGPPALLIRMSGSGHTSRIRWRPSASVTSAATDRTGRSTTSLSSAAVASTPPWSRPLITTSTPARASANAHALPSPLLDPQTIALRPAIPRSSTSVIVFPAECQPSRHRAIVETVNEPVPPPQPSPRSGYSTSTWPSKSFAPIPGRQGTDRLEQAYDVQDRLVDLLIGAGHGAPAGYKIGLTTRRMQQMCGIDHPISGVVFAGRVHHSPITIASADFVRLGIECELAVQLSRPIPDPAGPLREPGPRSHRRGRGRLRTGGGSGRRLSIPTSCRWSPIIVGTAVLFSGGRPCCGRLVTSTEFSPSAASSRTRATAATFSAIPWRRLNGLRIILARRNQVLAPGQWVMTGSIVPTKFWKRRSFPLFSWRSGAGGPEEGNRLQTVVIGPSRRLALWLVRTRSGARPAAAAGTPTVGMPR